MQSSGELRREDTIVCPFTAGSHRWLATMLSEAEAGCFHIVVLANARTSA
jgi:hypothetical protein